jgi:hypothetical protein
MKQIQKLCATIKMYSKCSSKCSGSDVLVSLIYVSLNMEGKSASYPLFRIPNCDPEVRIYVFLCYLKFQLILALTQGNLKVK